ncbi:ATPase [Sporosarcina sp. P18a]|uniref:AAA family ATPase n=1 Tax=Sporosarcina sp. P18a TaxID=2048259 RepID=UPI000C16AE1F|nr:AAA family ATPase [Sporosarcina sp. P18a]PIC81656.1 ATPase [Sporosarcina sp. P18a]
MKIKFKDLQLKNFKSHQDLSVNFGERTEITGDNAKGKSSITEAITWLLYGTDAVGSKLDPTPVTYEADSIGVYLTMLKDEELLTFGREANGTRNKFILDDVPSKATEFNEVINEMLPKDLFLSLYNPNHFFTLHWEKQREMLLSYTIPPANKEVFAQLPKPQAEKLAVLVKKHSLEDINKIHRDNKNKKDKAYIAAQSRTKTLQEQLQQYGSMIPLESLKVEVAQLIKERNEKEKHTDAAGDTNGRIRVLQSQIDGLTKQIDNGRLNHTNLKQREIDMSCHACGQDLTAESKSTAEENKEAQLKSIAASVNPLIQQRKELREELATLTPVDVSAELKEGIQTLQSKIVEIERQIDKHKQLEYLEADIEAAKTSEKETKESLNESIFILDAIKAFHAKEAELQAEKVQGLFKNLSIKLFDVVKSSGELKPTFEIQMDGKDYRKLSLSESIRAGLELRDVLSEQSGITAPCFVDNAESITKFDEPNGQLIISRVVAGQELKIESEGK